MRREQAPSYPVSIFIAGDDREAELACLAYCDDVGLCVTVTPTTYVYRGGYVTGVIVGLINYPRFPAEPADIEAKAVALGMRLREALGQESFSVQTPETTTWFSWRELDLAIADTHAQRGDGTKIAAPFMSGGGGEANRPTPNRSQTT